jgi:hypothetical protein
MGSLELFATTRTSRSWHISFTRTAHLGLDILWRIVTVELPDPLKSLEAALVNGGAQLPS